MYLKDFDGENVSNMASWIRGATRFLKANDATLYDEIGVVARALSTRSMTAYNQLIEMIYNNHRLGIKKTMVENMTITRLMILIQDWQKENGRSRMASASSPHFSVEHATSAENWAT